MSTTIYLILCAILSLLVLLGITMMSKVETAVRGNAISATSLFLGVILTLLFYEIFSIGTIYLFILIGSLIGLYLAKRVKMIEMPQLVALLNGVGGAASAFVGILSFFRIGAIPSLYETFNSVTAILAVVIGLTTLIGSLVAAGKLHKLLPQHPVIWKNHQLITNSLILFSVVAVVLSAFAGSNNSILLNPYFIIALAVISSGLFGYTFAIRVGGADMPITISLLNSLSGVAGAIAGMAIGDILLIAVGGIVGASGLLLTQIMCRGMNRDLMTILLGKTSVAHKSKVTKTKLEKPQPSKQTTDYTTALTAAKEVIIVPGYGMALAQAQHQVKQLADKFQQQGARVRFAIHPVAGRMPGHMNVLLAEADLPYDQLFEMEAINEDFKSADLVIVIGANDVLNPAARDAEGTPIYGMPILNVDQAKQVIICNFDTKPGYAGVENPLYESKSATLLLGDAKDSLQKILTALSQTKVTPDKDGLDSALLTSAKEVIIVPGYGMALAQAQHQVKQLADKFQQQGARVRFAIHPVAGRMPGHMNVLLAEADLPYDQLFEMEAINEDFKSADLVIVIGANDVLNPAARDAEGTPIYGMPILNVDQAKQVIICNFDTKPGYAGVENPLYESKSATLLLGDAKDSLQKILIALSQTKETPDKDELDSALLTSAKEVIIVPGYGMALAQAQHQVKQLADKFQQQGARVRFAIHPVAGRMPGHMNVLLAEADLPYDQLFEMEAINEDFKSADLVIVIGANDVLNPAARDAEGTPIYGMPILNVDQAKQVIICNFDTKPGYAGVENPLYESKSATLLLGDAKDSLEKLIDQLS